MGIDDCLTIIIPVKNEEEAIGKVLEELLGLGYKNIVVVDGHSTDGTREVVRRYGVKLVVQEGEGKGWALKTVLPTIRTPYVLVMDGDYTYDPTYIGKMLEYAELGEYDIVIGYRYWGREHVRALFRLGNWILARVINFLFDLTLHDPLSGMYLARTGLLRKIELGAGGFEVEADIIARVASVGGRIGEVPIRFRPRIGRKKLKVRHGISILLHSLKLALGYSPAFVILGASSLMLIPGLLLALYVLYEWLVEGVRHYVIGTGAFVMISIGVVSLVLLPLVAMIKRLEYRMLRHLSPREGALCRRQE